MKLLRSGQEAGEEDCVKDQGGHVRGVVKGAVYDMARGDENTSWARHENASCCA